MRKLRRADELAAEGKTGEEIAAELQVSPATLYNWRRTYGGLDTDAAKELKELREQQGRHEDILGSQAALKRTVIREIEADAKAHGDDRRTLVQEERRVLAEVRVIDEPVTVVVSAKGWVRALKGHEIEIAKANYVRIRTWAAPLDVLLDDAGRVAGPGRAGGGRRGRDQRSRPRVPARSGGAGPARSRHGADDRDHD